LSPSGDNLSGREWLPGLFFTRKSGEMDMDGTRKLLDSCDWLSEWSGKAASWLIFPLMFIITYDVIMRYAFNAPTIWAFDTGYMIGGGMVSIGMGYVLLHKGHVRVDVLYDRFSARTKLIVDFVLTIILFFPMMAIFIYTSWQYLVLSWVRGERSGYGIWEPTLVPFRFVVLAAWIILAVAGVAWFIRTTAMLFKGKEL
jgi:TRAP-type mannitol/chloroaromatic compound transport system permease small subunit